MEHNDRLTSTDDPNEVFDLVDEHDRVIGHVRRGEAHSDPRLVHRSVQVLVFDSHGRLFLQRRSMRKDLFGGYLCASASGHVAAGESYASTAERETLEELGTALSVMPIAKALVRSAQETELTTIFTANADGPFECHPRETDGGYFVTPRELLAGISRAQMLLTPAAICAIHCAITQRAWPMDSQLARQLAALLTAC